MGNFDGYAFLGLLKTPRPFPHMYLTDLYTQLGREDDAKRERAEAERPGGVPTGSVAKGGEREPH